MNNLRGIHFGSYWMGINDIVYLMALDLKDLCDLTIIDTDIYSRNRKQWYFDDFSYDTKRPIRWLNEKKVLDLIKDLQPDFVIINAGGMSLRPATINFLKNEGIITIGISLSDPDVFPANGKIYSEYYDIFYTNSQYALNHLYSKKANIKLLPFAASSKLHHPLSIEKTYDVVVVGHARSDRIKIIKYLKKYFNIGLFGIGWGAGYNPLHGEDHVKAINSGKIYLSFSKTVAGYINVKVGLFEAIACKTCVVTEMFEEMEAYFKYGIDILGYVNPKNLVDLIKTYLDNNKLRNWIADNAYKKLLQKHTWKKRWEKVLNDIQKCKLG